MGWLSKIYKGRYMYYNRGLHNLFEAMAYSDILQLGDELDIRG